MRPTWQHVNTCLCWLVAFVGANLMAVNEIRCYLASESSICILFGK